MTQHGLIKPRIVASAIQLIRFTVPDLCKDTGLSRKQVYPVLQELEENQLVLLDSRNQSERKANRPLNIYTLASAPEKKQALLEQIAVLHPTAVTSDEESESLLRARGALDELLPRLLSLDQAAGDLVTFHKNRFEVGELKTVLETIRGDLEISVYELGLAEGMETPEPLETELSRFKSFQQQLSSIASRVNAIERKLDAQKQAGYLLRRVVRRYIDAILPSSAHYWEPAVHLANSALADLHSWIPAFKDREPRRTGWARSNQDNSNFYQRVLKQRYERTDNLQLKTILSEFNNELAVAFEEAAEHKNKESPALVWQAFCEFGIRHASDPETPLGILDLFQAQSTADSQASTYNAINLRFLAGRYDQAFSSWRDWTEKHGIDDFTAGCSWTRDRAERTLYQTMVLAALPVNRLDEQMLARIRDTLGIAFAFSLISWQRLEALGPAAHVIEPTLTSLSNVSEPMRISDSMRMLTPEMHVYGPIENALRVPGVPRVALATAFAQLGMPQNDAWAFARDLPFETALIVVNSKEHIRKDFVGQFTKLEEIFSPVVPDSNQPIRMTSVGDRSRTNAEEQSHLVVYEREPVHGVLRQVHNLNLIPDDPLTMSSDE
jgi:hypothetical protein